MDKPIEVRMTVGEWMKLNALADHQLELLKIIHEFIVDTEVSCPVCFIHGCSDDCELAEAIDGR